MTSSLDTNYRVDFGTDWQVRCEDGIYVAYFKDVKLGWFHWSHDDAVQQCKNLIFKKQDELKGQIT